MILRAILWFALTLAIFSPAKADDLRDTATAAQIADVGTTAIGLALGAAEANPLGLLTLGAKAVAHQRISAAPAVEQPRLWGLYGAFGWGAAANNLCVIGTVASGGSLAPVCPLLGLVVGKAAWDSSSAQREEDTFAAICADAKASNPALYCAYTPQE